MREDVLAIPEHLRDAIWKVETAQIRLEQKIGMLVCGVGGSAIGADLATAILAGRMRRPVTVVRGYSVPAWVDQNWGALCSSYSGGTAETVECWLGLRQRGAGRIVATTGGRLGELARQEGDPVIGLPGIISQPRAAVAYMVVVALAAARSFGAAPDLEPELEQAAAWLSGQSDTLQSRAVQLAEGLGPRLPVIFGAGLTGPVARRWKGQLNENSKRHAFFSELPEASHNEVVAWGTAPASELAAIFLADPDQHPRERRTIEVMAEMVTAAGGKAEIVLTEGDSRTARLLWATMLGDLLSLELADRDGIDPEPIAPIEQLKRELP